MINPVEPITSLSSNKKENKAGEREEEVVYSSFEVYMKGEAPEEDMLLVVRSHPGNPDYTELLLVNEEMDTTDPLMTFENKHLDTIIRALKKQKNAVDIY